MHLRSRTDQRVTIPRATLTVSFREGETIWTESSHKYGKMEPFQIAKEAGALLEPVYLLRADYDRVMNTLRLSTPVPGKAGLLLGKLAIVVSSCSTTYFSTPTTGERK
jgi:hypothetical protein